ncbi:MAG: vWA domain-containing protein, partial [Pseudomonadota bacterium]
MNLLSALRARGALLLLCSLALLLSPSAWAAPATDVRVLVDISGSMKETDPNRLLIPAVEALIELLPDAQPASIWSFGEQVNRLMDHEPVTDLWRTQAQIKARALPAVGLRTALPAALTAATWDRSRPGPPRDLVLLTDGRLDLGPEAEENTAARRALLQTQLPELARAGYRIHALVLSQLGDLSLLRALTDGSDGQFVTVTDLAALPEQLADLVGRLRGLDELPRPSQPQALSAALPALASARPERQPAAAAGAAKPPAATRAAPPEPDADLPEVRFRVDPGLAELTLFIAGAARSNPAVDDPGQPVATLIAPDGAQYDQYRTPPNARWHVAGPREVVTLKTPQPGQWQLVHAAAKRLFSYGDLRLTLLDRPRQVAPGLVQTLGFALEDARTGVAVAPGLSALARYEAEIISEEGLPKASVERSVDGLQQIVLAQLQGVGQAEVILRAFGPTFERELRHQFRVAHPLRMELQPPPPSVSAPAAGAPGQLWAAVN